LYAEQEGAAPLLVATGNAILVPVEASSVPHASGT
jgi:hypothetical protein